MDDDHPIAFLLRMCFGDEEDDAAATEELRRQMTVYREQSKRFRAELTAILDERDETEALAAVEEFANRDVQGSGQRALDWLRALDRRLTN
jgi:hypothetical protein